MSRPFRTPNSHAVVGGPRAARLAVLALFTLLATLLQAPAAQAAPPATQTGEIARYGANFTEGAIDPATGYLDYTFINAMANKTMRVVSHTVDNRSVAGQELYDNTAVPSSGIAEMATNWSDNEGSSVSYTWQILPSDLRVTVQSTRYKDHPNSWQYEVVTCQFTRNGQVVTDVPFSCAAQFKDSGQYGHLTEYVVLKDANPAALSDRDGEALVDMLGNLCQNSDNGNRYAINCDIDFSESTPVFGYGLPVTLVSNDNCSSIAKTDSRTNTAGASATTSFNETTTLGAKGTIKFGESFELELSLSQSFSRGESWSTSTTDSTTYAIPSSPGTRGVLQIKYPTVTVTGDAEVDLIGSSIEVRDMTITLLQPGTPQSGNDEVHLGRVDCPHLPVDQFKFPPVN